ncbi:DUF1963 domain-containing protein [Achromobacter ruhlandii]|uniref:DUF1963 domain-containing protein n=1 Tax=Achromobacter ruhlandii TaxID=72557 RepID=UPI003BA25E11
MMDITPLPSDLDALRRSLDDIDLPADVVARLLAQARPALVLATAAADEAAIPLGASKIGGRPDLPPGMAWPTRPAYPDAAERAAGHRREADRLLAESKKKGAWMTPAQGERFSADARARADAVETTFPLTFLGQFDLATPAAALQRAPVPRALASLSDDEWTCVFRAAPVSARTVLTPIGVDDAGWDAFAFDDEDSYESYQDWRSRFGTPDMDGRDNHQLGGYPQSLQNGMQATCQLVPHGLDCGGHAVWKSQAAQALLPGARGWRLVLQIGADPHAGIPQPDAYYVLMREQDIAARRFDLARVTYQCD